MESAWQMLKARHHAQNCNPKTTNKIKEKGIRTYMNWLSYAVMTVFFWGVYGVLLHMGRGFMPMGPETPNAGLKAFLFVCVAYAVIGVAAYGLLKGRGSNMDFGTSGGITWSLVAGLAGAAGAFTLVLALGAAGSPVAMGGGGYGALAAVAVMPIVFGGAPIVNAIVTILKSPPADGIKAISPLFYLGMALAITGVVVVVKNAPQPAPGGHGPAPAAKPASAPAAK